MKKMSYTIMPLLAVATGLGGCLPGEELSRGEFGLETTIQEPSATMRSILSLVAPEGLGAAERSAHVRGFGEVIARERRDTPPRPGTTIDDYDLGQVLSHSSSVDGWAYTRGNLVDSKVYVQGEEIYGAHQRLIENATEEVLFQSYIWESGSEPVARILQGLSNLEQRKRAEIEAPDSGCAAVRPLPARCRPAVVKLILNHGPTALSVVGSLMGTKVVDCAALARQDVSDLHLDPRYVQAEVLTFAHKLAGSNHAKSIVADGQVAQVTGANAQHFNDRAIGWYDLGFVVAGDVARALRQDLINGILRAREGTEQDVDDRLGQTEKKELSRALARAAGVPYERPFETIFPLERVFSPEQAVSGVGIALLSRNAEGSVALDLPFASLFFGQASGPNNNTQNRGFQAAFYGARRVIRLQTPNLNDDAVIRALAQAARRGVRLELLLSRKFNCKQENLPGQGGQNARGILRLRQAIGPGALGRLDVRWFSVLDSAGNPRVVVDNPDGQLPADRPQNSHAKFLSIDGALSIVGSANMDTQSWNHARELNLAIDSPEVTLAWEAQTFDKTFASALPVPPADLLEENIHCRR